MLECGSSDQHAKSDYGERKYQVIGKMSSDPRGLKMLLQNMTEIFYRSLPPRSFIRCITHWKERPNSHNEGIAA